MVDIAEFIARWSNSHGSERGNSQRFLTEFKTAEPIPWPKDETGRIAILLKTLRSLGREATTNEIAAGIKGASAAKIERVAQSLAVHGLIRKSEKGYLG